MNAAQARRTPAAAVMRELGHTPSRETGREWWYASPFRRERTPSFKISRDKPHLWYDFGEGRGGNTLDLVVSLKNCGVAEALAFIRGLSSAVPLPPLPAPAAKPEPAPPAIVIQRLEPLRNPALTRYVEERGIAPELAARHLREAYFGNRNRPGRNYFALAFPNDAGGFELRNARYQGCAAPKAPTTITGTAAGKALNVFEGFFDFLAALTLAGQTRPEQDVVVLNSLALLDKAAARFDAYDQINLFLDADPAGRAAATKFPQARDMAAAWYPAHKDVNDWLLKEKKAAGQPGFRL